MTDKTLMLKSIEEEFDAPSPKRPRSITSGSDIDGRNPSAERMSVIEEKLYYLDHNERRIVGDAPDVIGEMENAFRQIKNEMNVARAAQDNNLMEQQTHIAQALQQQNQMFVQLMDGFRQSMDMQRAAMESQIQNTQKVSETAMHTVAHEAGMLKESAKRDAREEPVIQTTGIREERPSSPSRTPQNPYGDRGEGKSFQSERYESGKPSQSERYGPGGNNRHKVTNPPAIKYQLTTWKVEIDAWFEIGKKHAVQSNLRCRSSRKAFQ